MPMLTAEQGERGAVEPDALPRRSAPLQAAGKTVLDIGIAVLGLVVSAPVILVAAVAIKATDGGPVLYRQVRVGRDGEHFTIFKLRTMVVGAEDMIIDLRERNQRDGPLFKLSHDPRVTRVGRWLRVTTIDEVPQLINVLRREMSVVGPRPALPSEVDWFDEPLLERHAVRPGITGLWQIAARDHPSFDAYQTLDLHYVRNWSLRLDLVVLARTVRVVARRGWRALRSGRSHILD